MKKCEKCGALITSDDIFCGICGATVPKATSQVERKCPKCQTPALPEDTFCGVCGAPLPTQPEPPKNICLNCKTPYLSDDTFCGVCGAKIEEDAQRTPVYEPPRRPAPPVQPPKPIPSPPPLSKPVAQVRQKPLPSPSFSYRKDTTSKSHGSKGLFIFICVAVLLIAAAVGGYFGFKWYEKNSLGGPTSNNMPTKVMTQNKKETTSPTLSPVTPLTPTQETPKPLDVGDVSENKPPYFRLEYQIINNEPLDNTNLSQCTKTELRFLRNTIFARHGKTFGVAILQQYFSEKQWYRINPTYTEALLTEQDKTNADMIKTFEQNISPTSSDYELEAVINDPDGFTNVRQEGNETSPIVATVKDQEVFLTYEQKDPWWTILTSKGVSGYMHSSRIRILGPVHRDPEEIGVVVKSWSNSLRFSFQGPTISYAKIRIENDKLIVSFPQGHIVETNLEIGTGIVKNLISQGDGKEVQILLDKGYKSYEIKTPLGVDYLELFINGSEGAEQKGP